MSINKKSGGTIFSIPFMSIIDMFKEVRPNCKLEYKAEGGKIGLALFKNAEDTKPEGFVYWSMNHKTGQVGIIVSSEMLDSGQHIVHDLNLNEPKYKGH